MIGIFVRRRRTVNMAVVVITTVIMNEAGQLIVVVQGSVQRDSRLRHHARCSLNLRDKHQRALHQKRQRRHEHGCSGAKGETLKENGVHEAITK